MSGEIPMSTTWCRLLAGFVFAVAGLAACGESDGTSNPAKASEFPSGSGLVFPEGTSSLVGVGQDEFLALVAQADGGGVLRSVRLVDGQVVVGDPAPLPDKRPFGDAADLIELTDGSWLVGIKTCSEELGSALLDECEGAPIVRLYRYRTGAVSFLSQLDGRVDPFGFTGELADGTVLIHSTAAPPGRSSDDLQGSAFDTFYKVDPSNGDLVSTEWQHVAAPVRNGAPIRTVDACPMGEGFAVFERGLSDSGQSINDLIIHTADSEPRRLALGVHVGEIACGRDHLPVVAEQNEGIVRTWQIGTSGTPELQAEARLDGEFYGFVRGPGTVTAKSLPAANEDPVRADYAVLAYAGGSWIESPIPAHLDEVVRVTGNGRALLASGSSGVRVWGS